MIAKAFIEAFANIYHGFCDDIRAKLMGQELGTSLLDYPSILEGARGVYFINKAVESSNSAEKWLPMNFEL